MHEIPWALSWGQLPIGPILGCNCNYWQAQKLQLPNRFLSRRLSNAWVFCQVHDFDSIARSFTMNVIIWASIWGQLPICPILGCNCNYWQAQNLPLLNRFLSRRLNNAWVFCQVHDYDYLAESFTINVIPWASIWGHLPICPILGCNCNYWQCTEPTPAQQASVPQP